VGKWAGAGMAVLILVFWLATAPLLTNRPLNLNYQGSRIEFGIARGKIIFLRCMEKPVSWDWMSDRNGLSLARSKFADPVDISHYGIHWPEVFRGTKYLTIYVPLWLPFLLVLLPAGFLWFHDRRSPHGSCVNCGYDLTKNESGACPECGAAVPTA